MLRNGLQGVDDPEDVLSSSSDALFARSRRAIPMAVMELPEFAEAPRTRSLRGESDAHEPTILREKTSVLNAA